MEKPPIAPRPPLGPHHSRSLPRRLSSRSKSGSSLLKPFEFHPVPISPPPPPDDNDDVDADSEEPETDLRDHLHHEMRMREGSTKLLAVAQDPEVVLEGAKSLLVSEQRMNYFRKELQRRKSGESFKALFALPPDCVQPLDVSSSSSSPSPSVPDQRPCRAVISLSEIRIPLMWPEKEHFKNRGFLRRFAVFCLARVGAQIRDTSLVACVDRSATDISFHDALLFKRVPPDFECVLEIYAHNLDDVEAVSTPSLIRRKFSHVTASVGRSVGRRMAAGMKGGEESLSFDDDGSLSGGSHSPEFALVARTTLRLDDVDEYGRAFDLEILAGDSTPDKLPLFGQISCRLAARPSLKVKTTMEGELRIKDAMRTRWSPFWCRLRDRHVFCWSSCEEAESGRPAYLQIPVSAYRTQLSLPSSTSSHTTDTGVQTNGTAHVETLAYILVLRDDVDTSEYHLSAPDEASLETWRAALHRHLLDQSTWGRLVCESSMEIHGLDESSFTSSSPDFLHDCFDSPAAGSPFGSLMRRPRSGSGKSVDSATSSSTLLRKSPKLARANNLYESVAIPSPRAASSASYSSSTSSSSASASPRHHRRTPSSSSGCSSSSSSLLATGGAASKSTPTTPKASSTTLTAFPSLDEEELDKLFLKYTSSSSSSSAADDKSLPSSSRGFHLSMTSSPSKRFNTLFPSMTLKPSRTNKKLPL